MKKKIVLLNSCKGLYGGVESFLLNVFRGLDKTQFEIVFLTCGVSTYEMYRNEIENAGGTVKCIQVYPKDLKTQMIVYKKLKDFFCEYEPDVIHVNSSALSFQILSAIAAKKAGVKSRVLHSHNFVPNINPCKKIIRNILKPILTKYGTRFLACSSGAAEWMFEKKIQTSVEIIPNGINTEEFRYSKEKRDIFRKEFNISEDTMVLGNIGRFQKQKNHFFLVDIFAEYLKRNQNSLLLLAGKGELQPAIMEYVQTKNISNKVIFLGERNDMGFFFSAIDVFVLPSLFEGLPIAALEAQASGVPCFLSDTITTETNISNKIKFISIDSVDKWIKALNDIEISDNRQQDADYIFLSGYDKKESGLKMSRIYMES